MNLKRLSDGIIFQFLMVGSLSFSHIHDVVAAHGQAGWKSWLYPPSVDLLTVAAYRRILAARRENRHDPMAWCTFLLGLSASLAANVVDSWAAIPSGLVLAVAIGVWPAVALLACTLLGHDQAEPGQSTEAPAESAPAQVPAPAVLAAASARPAVAVQVVNPVAAVAPAPAPSAELPPIAAPLLSWARGIADQHRQTTGQLITPDALASRLRIAPALAEAVHEHLITGPAGAEGDRDARPRPGRLPRTRRHGTGTARPARPDRRPGLTEVLYPRPHRRDRRTPGVGRDLRPPHPDHPRALKRSPVHGYDPRPVRRPRRLVPRPTCPPRLTDVGIELDPAACATRAAAGHTTIRADVAAFPVTRLRGRVRGLLALPAVSGHVHRADCGAGWADLDTIAALLADLAAGRNTRTDHAATVADPRSLLIAEPLRYALAAMPEWIACEQVPAVLPLWRETARHLEAVGYRTRLGAAQRRRLRARPDPPARRADRLPHPAGGLPDPDPRPGIGRARRAVRPPRASRT